MRIYCQELQGDVIVKQLIGICKGSIPDTYIRIIKDRYLTMKYKAIALDLDGTLTDHNKKLPEANKGRLYGLQLIKMLQLYWLRDVHYLG